MSDLSQQRGAVRLDLDRPRILFFDLAATFLLVEEYGMDFVSELYQLKVQRSVVDVTSTDSMEWKEKRPGATVSKLVLKSKDALCYFLWAGLQAELAGSEETLTLEQAGDLVKPWNVRDIFYALVRALTGTLSAPEPAGKAEVARPAAKRTTRKQPGKTVHPGPAAVSASLTRSASRSRR